MPNSGSPPFPIPPEPGGDLPLRGERRLTRRVEILGALVDVEVLGGTVALRFPVFALDLNVDGMGLALPAEAASGARVAMTFQLAADFRLVGVEGKVVYNRGDRAGIRWVGWEEEERLRLLEYLDRRYHETAP